MPAIEIRPPGRTNALPVDRASLFLDLDGTLMPFEEDPDAVRADDACVEMLVAAQARLGGRLAVLSGRSVASVDEVLRGSVTTVAGVHGLQWRTPAVGLTQTPTHPAVASAADALEAFAQAYQGLLLERKGQSVAIHFRKAPTIAAEVIALAESLAAGLGLEVQHGVMVAELRPPGPDKGTALRRFMGEAPFAGSRPIFVGDDLTDEAAFVAAQSLGGAGILVGLSRPTAASGRLSGVDAVRGWIMHSLETGVFDLRQAEPAGSMSVQIEDANL